MWESFPQSVDSPVAVAFVDTLFTDGPNSVEAYFVALATWFEVHSYSWSGGLMVHFRDINARKAGEVERERLLHTDCGGGRHSGECGGRDRSASAGNVGGGDCGRRWCRRVGADALRAARVKATLTTGGLANPVVATGETVGAASITALAIFVPVIALVYLILAGVLVFRITGRRRRSRDR